MRLRSLFIVLLLLATACAGGSGADSETTISGGDSESAVAPTDGDASSGAEPATQETAADEGGAAVAAGPQAPADVPEVLDFQATSVSGETVSGGDFAGQDLMLWFWAPW